MQLLRVAADLDANGGRAAQSEVEQHEVGLLLLQQPPVSRLVLCCSDYFCLGNVGAHDTEGSFEFEGYILNDDDFEIFHIIFNFDF